MALVSKNSMHGPEWEGVRLGILDRDGWLCTWPSCSKPLEGSDATVDHIVSVAEALKMGWTRAQINDPSNLAAMCRLHNGMKRDQVVIRIDYLAPRWFDSSVSL